MSEQEMSEVDQMDETIRIRLPGFIRTGDEIGLGEVIKRATATAGMSAPGGCAGSPHCIYRRAAPIAYTEGARG